MSRIVRISVVSNSRLSALARACALAQSQWNLDIMVTLFSTLPPEVLQLPLQKIQNFYHLPQRPQPADYKALVETTECGSSSRCFLFFTRLVPACVYTAVETINFHPSLLPEHPGLGGYASAIAAEQLAISAHRVDASIDGGDILRQYAISPFPEGRSLEYLQQESSILCSAAILSLLNSTAMDGSQPLTYYGSGDECLQTVLAQKYQG